MSVVRAQVFLCGVANVRSNFHTFLFSITMLRIFMTVDPNNKTVTPANVGFAEGGRNKPYCKRTTWAAIGLAPKRVRDVHNCNHDLMNA